MSNVSVYVVDLKRVQPFLGGALMRSMEVGSSMQQSETAELLSAQIPPTSGESEGASVDNTPKPHLVTSSSIGQRSKPGQSMRKSFVKEKPGPNGQRPRYVIVLDVLI